MPTTITPPNDSLPFLVFPDDLGSYGMPQPPLAALSDEQRASVRSFEEAVAGALATATADNPRPVVQSVDQLREIAERLGGGDDAVRAHIEHIMCYRILPATCRMTVVEFEQIARQANAGDNSTQ